MGPASSAEVGPAVGVAAAEVAPGAPRSLDAPAVVVTRRKAAGIISSAAQRTKGSMGPFIAPARIKDAMAGGQAGGRGGGQACKQASKRAGRQAGLQSLT